MRETKATYPMQKYKSDLPDNRRECERFSEGAFVKGTTRVSLTRFARSLKIFRLSDFFQGDKLERMRS